MRFVLCCLFVCSVFDRVGVVRFGLPLFCLFGLFRCVCLFVRFFLLVFVCVFVDCVGLSWFVMFCLFGVVRRFARCAFVCFCVVCVGISRFVLVCDIWFVSLCVFV